MSARTDTLRAVLKKVPFRAVDFEVWLKCHLCEAAAEELVGGAAREDELVGGELALAGAVVPRVVAGGGIREEAAEVSGAVALAGAGGDVCERLRLAQVLRGGASAAEVSGADAVGGELALAGAGAERDVCDRVRMFGRVRA